MSDNTQAQGAAPWIIKGVILDIDGTLIDSNAAHAQSWVDVFTENGYQVEFEKIMKLIGMGSDRLMPAAIGVEKSSPEGKKMTERRAEIFKERYLSQVKALPGTRELLQHFKESGLQLVVATSAKQDELEPLLKIAGALDLVEEKTSAEETGSSKPAPDVVEVALQKIGLSSQQVVMLGDTPYDIEAASRAKVPTIAFRSGGWDNQGLRGAIEIYNDPADLLAHYDQSAFGTQPVKDLR